MKRFRARFTFTLVATTLIGAVLPIVAVIAQSSAAAALPIVAQGTDTYYSTNLHYSDTMNYPPGATGFTQETFTTTVASQPSWKSDAAYFYANQVGFSAVPQPAPTLEDEGSIYSAAGNPSTTSFPTSYGDLLVAFVSSQTIASNLTVTGTAAGHAALPFTRLTLPNNPSSIAIFTAFDYYLPATTSVVVSVGNAAAGPVMGLTVEAYSIRERRRRDCGEQQRGRGWSRFGRAVRLHEYGWRQLSVKGSRRRIRPDVSYDHYPVSGRRARQSLDRQQQPCHPVGAVAGCSGVVLGE